MKQVYVKILGIHCSHCEGKIITKLLENKKIKDVKIKRNIACISYEGRLSNQEIIDSIQSIDYFTKEEYISENLKDLDTNIHFMEFVIIFVCILIFAILIEKFWGFDLFNMIPTIDSTMTYGMLFVTGVLTSIHCISMCGAINLMAVINQNSKISIKRPILYNLGRVISYTFLGGFVGLLGSVICINETVKGIIVLAAAVFMFFMSLQMLGVISFKFPRFIRLPIKIKSKNAFIIGLLNGFMPCGPLQAMQVYALSTGSFVKGAFSMFLFGIGTVPCMLFVGVIFNLFRGKWKVLFNKVAAVLILILSFFMIFRGLLSFGIDISQVFSHDDAFISSVMKDGYQEVILNLSYSSYGNIVVQKGVPVRMVLHVDKKNLTGCNNELVISSFDIKVELKDGDNIIEFIPSNTGLFSMTCWMNMITNTIKVIDSESYFEKSGDYICSNENNC